MKTKRKPRTITRTSRIWFNDVNSNKLDQVRDLIIHATNIQRFYVDQAWEEQRFDGKMPTLQQVHRGRNRFGAAVRLVQPMAKQASEIVASQHKLDNKTKPVIRKNTITLYYHHIQVEQTKKLTHFDWVLTLKGASVPTLELPFHGHKHLNTLLSKGYEIARTVRFGLRGKQVYADLILKKQLEQQPKRSHKHKKTVVGIDLNLIEGVVTSAGQKIPMSVTPGDTQQPQRKRHQLAREQADRAAKQINLDGVDEIVLEDLRRIKHNTRGTFPRSLNRRLSYWHRGHFTRRLVERTEEKGVAVHFVHPSYTSQFCRECYRWDRRNRNGTRFKCVNDNCQHEEHADSNAAHNIRLLRLAGVYGLRQLPNAKPLVDDSIVCPAFT